MATPSLNAPAALERRETPRLALARLAAAAASAQPGVSRLDAGTAGRFTTAVAGERLAGVTVVADGGRYAVALYVAAAPTDLHALAAAIVASVQRAAAAEQLQDLLGDVHVTFTDLTLPGETDHA